MTAAVFFRHGDTLRPVFKILERDEDQVVVVIRSEPDEHFTLHRERDGGVMLTHWSRHKPPSVWDEARVRIARKLGHRDPDRHGQYYAHWPLVPVGGMDGYELFGRLIRLEAARPKERYTHLPHIVLEAPAREFFVTFHLSTPERRYSSPDEPHVATGLGDIYFRATLPPRSR